VRMSFDRIADRYDETRAYPAGVTEGIIMALERSLAKEGKVLDVGVGTGRLAAPMRSAGFDVVGIDVSRRMLEKARRKGLSQLFLADARALPFLDSSFEYSLSVHLTHLVSDWVQVLSEIGRVTSERYVSVATESTGCQVEEMQRAYEAACADLGHEVKHPGMRERDLIGRMRPAAAIEVADSVEGVMTADAIERYRGRIYSDLWGVPDDVHDHAVRRLEELYGASQRLQRRERISLIVWDAETVREYVALGSEGKNED
jgi:SAM-dependent methyltransferase